MVVYSFIFESGASDFGKYVLPRFNKTCCLMVELSLDLFCCRASQVVISQA